MTTLFRAYSLSNACLAAKQVRLANIWRPGFSVKILREQIQFFKVDPLQVKQK